MARNQKGKHSIIMIAKGFDEEPTITCLNRLREAGLKVLLVGLTTHSVVGAHGVTIHPDYSLEELPIGREPRLMVIPGSNETAARLVTDPRVHRMIEATVRAGGLVAIFRRAESALAQAGLLEMLSKPYCLRQGSLDYASFCHDLSVTARQ